MRNSMFFVLAIGTLSACGPRSAPEVHTRANQHGDTAFSALQERGGAAMGVDQYTSTHRFDALPDGGRIELQSNEGGSVEVAQIREHLQQIAIAFAAGDFSTPAFVHMRKMPGVAVMAREKAKITYRFDSLPRGGEIRITTHAPEALAAVHQFMAAQRGDHRAGGHSH